MHWTKKFMGGMGRLIGVDYRCGLWAVEQKCTPPCVLHGNASRNTLVATTNTMTIITVDHIISKSSREDSGK